MWIKAKGLIHIQVLDVTYGNLITCNAGCKRIWTSSSNQKVGAWRCNRKRQISYSLTGAHISRGD